MSKVCKVIVIKKIRENSDKIVSGIVVAVGGLMVFKGIRKLIRNRVKNIEVKTPEELKEEFDQYVENKQKKLIRKRKKRIRKAIRRIVVGTIVIAVGVITFTPYKGYLIENSAVDKIKDSDVVGKIKDSSVVGKIKESDVVGKVKDKEVIAKIKALLDRSAA